jgi:predicted MFS family arabinose efflux permease
MSEAQLIPAAEGRFIRRSTVYAVVIATTLAQIASVMGIAVFPVIAPRLAAEIGVAPAAIGYQISLIYGAATIGSPLMSFAVTRWGACRATQVGLACCVAAMALALTAAVWALVAASLLLGLAMTLMTPASTHLLFRFSPPQNRNLIFSIKQTGVPGGWVVMALIAPPITLSVGWRWAAALVLAVAAILVVLLQGVRAQWDDDRKPGAAVRVNPLAGLVAVWRHAPLRWLAIASLTLSFVQLCLGTFLVTMLVQEADYSLVAAGVMLSVVQASGVAGRILWGYIADRTGDSLGLLRRIALTATACCVGIAFLTPAWPQLLIALFFVVFGAAAVGWNGLFLAEVARTSPRGLVSQSTSAAMTWNFAGILLGPAIFAAMYGATGSYTTTYLMLAIVAVAGFVLLSLSGAAGRRERAAA